jgi:hypothetical protein
MDKITQFHIVLEWRTGSSWCYTVHMTRGDRKRIYQDQPNSRILALIRIAGQMRAETTQSWHGSKVWHFGADLLLQDR